MPSPAYIFRFHRHPLSTLHVSKDNERIYSADSSGFVVVSSTRSMRAIAKWQAHKDSVLAVEEWGAHVITQGRDNRIYLWARVEDSTPSMLTSASSPDLPSPSLCSSADVNALNFCRLSLLDLGNDPNNELTCFLGGSRDASPDNRRCLIAIPNLVETSLADIWAVPGFDRIHAAIGKREEAATRGTTEAHGIIMAIHLFAVPVHADGEAYQLRTLCAYENGSVQLRKYSPNRDRLGSRRDYRSVEGTGWERMWSCKVHVETIMAMTVSQDNALALTVSADNLVVKYNLEAIDETNISSLYRTKSPGNASVAIYSDGKLCAVGGWDGSIRLYSTRTFKLLGTLDYHKEGCQVVALAYPFSPSYSTTDAHADEDDMSIKDMEERGRWLVGGGKDGKISVWALKAFSKS